MIRRWMMAALLLGVGAAAQSGLAPVSNVVPPSYIIGPNDVLGMTVFGDPELSDNAMRVDADGTIRTPFGSSPVHVAGLDLDGVQKAIAAALVKDQLTPPGPKVEVTVVDPESHPITITGLGIRATGTLQAIQPLRLAQALARAGGLSDNNAQITVLTRNATGATQERHYSAQQVMTALNDGNNPLLYGGEEVQVMPGGNAYLSGAVMTPGAYPLNDADPLTVRKALAKAHGLQPTAKGSLTQFIQNAGEPNQTVRIINLDAIMKGSAPDIRLAANDMIYVPTSGAKRAGLTAITQSISIATIVAGELLVK